MRKIQPQGKRHVDAMLCGVSSAAQKSQAVRPDPVRMRMGVVAFMAKVIEFYVPNNFRKKRLWIPAEQRGKLIAFPPAERKSA
jgi:hypothetical protein